MNFNFSRREKITARELSAGNGRNTVSLYAEAVNAQIIPSALTSSGIGFKVSDFPGFLNDDTH